MVCMSWRTASAYSLGRDGLHQAFPSQTLVAPQDLEVLQRQRMCMCMCLFLYRYVSMYMCMRVYI